jgi:hypothetical protein
LEKVQREAIIIATGAKRGTIYSELAEKTGWPSLKERRTYQVLVQMYKILHNLAAQGLIDMMPRTTEHRNPYNVRAAAKLNPPSTKLIAQYP